MRYISLVLCVLDAVFVFKTHQVSYRLMTFYLFDAYIEDNAEENKGLDEDFERTHLVLHSVRVRLQIVIGTIPYDLSQSHDTGMMINSK